MDKFNILDVNGNLKKTIDEPCITLSFTKGQDEVIYVVGETFRKELQAFFGPHEVILGV